MGSGLVTMRKKRARESAAREREKPMMTTKKKKKMNTHPICGIMDPNNVRRRIAVHVTDQ